MSRPNISTQIFLDSADPQDTAQALQALGFLDGQTTNPSLIGKVKSLQEITATGRKFSTEEALGEYKKLVQEIEKINPGKPLSIQVYADETSTKDDLLIEVDEISTWIDDPHVKLPLIRAGLETAEQCAADGIKINMTLCFSIEQGLATYSATLGSSPGDVFVSPFVGRLEDQGIDGMDLVKNLLEVFKNSDHHVSVLAASIRSMEHFVECIELGSNAVTASLPILLQWQQLGFPTTLGSLPPAEPSPTTLQPLPATQFHLNTAWRSIPIDHELTKAGLQKFVTDWDNLISTGDTI